MRVARPAIGALALAWGAVLPAVPAFADVDHRRGPAADQTQDFFSGRETLGPLAIEPTTGDLFSPLTLTTGGGCPHGDHTLTRVFGPGFPWYGENVVGNTRTSLYGSPPADRLAVPMTITLDEARLRQPEPPKLNGAYKIVLTCRDAIESDGKYEYGDYVGSLNIAEDGSFTATTTAAGLPDPPSPKAGPESLALGQEQPEPTPDLEAIRKLTEDSKTAAEERDRQAAEASDDHAGYGVPLAVGGGIVVIGLGGMFLAGRQSSKTSTRVRL